MNHIARFPPKKILVPLDLSDASVAAWEQARGLARQFDAKIEGLYVQPWLYQGMSVYTGTAVPGPEATEQATRKALVELRSKFGPKADVRAVAGGVEETILSWEREHAYDLVVMATHERSGLERTLQGSMAEIVMRRSSIPVLVTRGKPDRIRSVLAPVNFETYAMEGLRMAGNIARELHARLTVLYVLDYPVYGDSSMAKGPKALLADAIHRLPESVRKDCRPRARIAFGKADEEIVSVAKNADLVVMVAHRKGFLHDVILGTTVERVLRHSAKPVWAIPSGASARALSRGRAAAKGRWGAAVHGNGRQAVG